MTRAAPARGPPCVPATACRTESISEVVVEEAPILDRINTLFNNLITWGGNIALTVAAFFLMWGAFIYMSAGGSPRQMETGKSAMVHALIGLVIVLAAKSIATVVRNAIGGP